MDRTGPEATVGTETLPEPLARTLRQFQQLDRESKMQTLLSWSRRLEPLPERLAVLAILFSGVNGQPPAVTLALPGDLVSQLMQNIGLGAREAGLSAMLQRLKQHAVAARAADATS